MMSNYREIQVRRENILETRELELPRPDLGEGQVRVAIDKFALTANNVTYAVAGDMIGYWNFYPREEGWGVVPVWGIGEVVESAHPGVPVGERLYGFYPMASEVVLVFDQVEADTLMEASPHRQELPATYNAYRRTAADPEFLQQMEEARCLFFPLFATAYLLYDFLLDNALFGAGQVLIGSASSKTAFGMAKLLHGDEAISARLVGLTSAGNKEFVESLGCYDSVVCYGDEDDLDTSLAAAYVDMSGNAGLTAKIHQLFGDQLKVSTAVGATHWESFGGDTSALPGPAPEFFFAPAQIEKRDAEWGRGEVMRRAGLAVAEVAKDVASSVTIERMTDVAAASAAWRDLVENRVAPTRGLMVSL
jgi:hypothetical protein